MILLIASPREKREPITFTFFTTILQTFRKSNAKRKTDILAKKSPSFTVLFKKMKFD